MTSQPFLIVGGYPISLAQALAYLKDAGKLQNLVDEIGRNHIITQHLQTMEPQAIIPRSLSFDLRLKALKAQIAAPKLQQYFIHNKLKLDRVILSRIVVATKGLAEELKLDIEEKKSTFEELARQYSLTPERLSNGMMGAVSRADLSETLRSEIDAAEVGNLIGPLEMQDRWCLIRLEGCLPAALDDNLKAQLETEIFEQWLTANLQNTDIKLAIHL
ncbi:peptidylprolyl isomerase [Pseudanabaena sp. PCC 6802]|uniref:peptidylprolyl isomerase n=1 Tax=Pseudanabaena sp. PCC 6802 TaxID=118173 RepID=UPI000347E748|nr:peptidylprolyl isomerase [Pseudanabaena sp. PCC 6802]